MKEATIFDYSRMCRTEKVCDNCPLWVMNNGTNLECNDLVTGNPDKANKIILKWCKEHPVKTRQDKFLEMFPNAHIYTDGVLEAKPCHIDETAECSSEDDCDLCRSKYWLAEVNTNES